MKLKVLGEGTLPSCYAVTDLAVCTTGAAFSAMERFAECRFPTTRSKQSNDRSGSNVTTCAESAEDALAGATAVAIDRRLASLWFGFTLQPTPDAGWELPPSWDPLAGDYQAQDGTWIKLHTNAPHHRSAALRVLGLSSDTQNVDRDRVSESVAAWATATELHEAVSAAGGVAAAMMTAEEWDAHPQGRAVAEEPLVHWSETAGDTSGSTFQEGCGDAGNAVAAPLSKVKVLDLTRVLAGPVATRFLAAFGAEVLRVDPPTWDEPGVVPEITLGKRCTGLDLHDEQDRRIFEGLVREADVLLHGYRPGAMDRLGYDSSVLLHLNPNLIDVSLNAYGWSGPWCGRRGFDSLVQMSMGIAARGGQLKNLGHHPRPLPVQALDHATGYLLATAALHALSERLTRGRILRARLSLAATGHLLRSADLGEFQGHGIERALEDLDPAIEATAWGPGRRVRFPVSSRPPRWQFPATALRSSPPHFQTT